MYLSVICWAFTNLKIRNQATFSTLGPWSTPTHQMLIILTPPSHFLSSARAVWAPIRQQRGSRPVQLVNYACGQAFLENAASPQSDLEPLTAADAVFSHGQRTNGTTKQNKYRRKRKKTKTKLEWISTVVYEATLNHIQTMFYKPQPTKTRSQTADKWNFFQKKILDFW